MILTGYWKFLVLAFSEMGNTVFSLAKKLTEIWCLLITGKFLCSTFRWLEIRSFFRVKKLMERCYLLVTEKFLFWAFWWSEIWSFFQPKIWWKDDIYVVFLSFLWYSRMWKICFFCAVLFTMGGAVVNELTFSTKPFKQGYGSWWKET